MILRKATTYTMGGSPFLSIDEKEEGVGGPLDWKTVATFELRFLRDTNEVALIKGDEIVYSELLS